MTSKGFIQLAEERNGRETRITRWYKDILWDDYSILYDRHLHGGVALHFDWYSSGLCVKSLQFAHFADGTSFACGLSTLELHPIFDFPVLRMLGCETHGGDQFLPMTNELIPTPWLELDAMRFTTRLMLRYNRDPNVVHEARLCTATNYYQEDRDEVDAFYTLTSSRSSQKARLLVESTKN
jgi:hypothetical protein